MKRFILIISVIVAIFAVVALVSFWLKSGEPAVSDRGGLETGETNDNLSISQEGVEARDEIGNLPKGEVFIVGSQKGGIRVKNFYLENPEHGPFTRVILKESEEYNIYFYRADGSFEIVFRSDHGADPSLAALDLLSILGITRAEACRLDAYLIYPFDMDRTQVFPLSFCEENVQ